MKRTLTLFLCFLLAVNILLPPSVAAASSYGYVTANSLNVREKADSGSKILKVIHSNDKVTILGSKGNWYQIQVGSKKGYVSKNYVSKSASTQKKTSTTTVSTSKTLSKGSNGSEVKKLQQKLKELGYFSGSTDGKYGNSTVKAVKAFQKAKGLTQDGVAGPATLKAMNKTTKSAGKYTTEQLNWFKNGSKTIPKGSVFEVKDCLTGKVFTCRRWSGVNHLDAEPRTAEDTRILKSIYGSWSWRRRPILVKYNGHVYAASMNGMPHGTNTIKGNKFDGHFCIHFTNSKTHQSKKVDPDHQNCVKKALKYTW